jgi:hypothetical protein
MEKFQTQKLTKSVVKTIVQRLFKILSADGFTSASKIEKMAKKLKSLMFF